MKNKLFKIITLSLALIFFIPNGHASTGFKDLLNEYKYAVTVEWDQKDQAFLKAQEKKLILGITDLIQKGHLAQELLGEILEQIPDVRLREDLRHTLERKISREELKEVIETQLQNMNAQGTSWSPALKVLAAIALGYVTFKVILLVIYFWDYDPNYGGTDPNVPPKGP